MRRLEFSPSAVEELVWWLRKGPQKARRIADLLDSIARTPEEGIGQPERLKYDFRGYWSRRIDQEHRIVYQISEEAIRVVSCRTHYGDK